MRSNVRTSNGYGSPFKLSDIAKIAKSTDEPALVSYLVSHQGDAKQNNGNGRLWWTTAYKLVHSFGWKISVSAKVRMSAFNLPVYSVPSVVIGSKTFMDCINQKIVTAPKDNATNQPNTQGNTGNGGNGGSGSGGNTQPPPSGNQNVPPVNQGLPPDFNAIFNGGSYTQNGTPDSGGMAPSVIVEEPKSFSWKMVVLIAGGVGLVGYLLAQGNKKGSSHVG